MSTYLNRYIVVVDWKKLQAANGMAHSWDPDVGGAKTFGSVRLSPTGSDPPTHTACNTAANVPIKAGILNALHHVPWARLYDIYNDGWTWQAVLDDMGLQEIKENM